MKKKLILLLIIVISLSTVLVACSNNKNAPAAAWAGDEVLEYDITTLNGEKIGTMVSELRRKQSPSFSNKIDEKTYDADNSFELHIDTDKIEITTKVLAKGYQSIAQKKVYVDKENSENNYTLISYHSGNYYYYSINGKDQERIKITASYTESEFLYNYIRCYGIDSLPTSIKMFNSISNKVSEVGAVNTGETKVFDILYPDGKDENDKTKFTSKSIKCNKLEITLKDSPIGKPIELYYTPDQEEYNLSSFSMDTSKKFPVCIIENDVKYTLKSIQIA